MWVLAEYGFGFHTKYISYHVIVTNFVVIPAVWIFWIAFKAKKKQLNGLPFTYINGLKYGVLISLVVAILSPFSFWIYIKYINPDFFNSFIQYAVATQQVANIEAAETYFNTNSYLIQSAVGALIMGTLTSAIIMLRLRTKA